MRTRPVSTALAALAAAVLATATLGTTPALAADLAPADTAAAAPFSLSATAVTAPVAVAGEALPVSVTVASGCATTRTEGDCGRIDVTLTYQNMSSGQWGQVSGMTNAVGGTLVLSIPGDDVQPVGLSYRVSATQACGSTRTTSQPAVADGATGFVLVAAAPSIG